MPEPAVIQRLFAEPYVFDFFQAVRLLWLDKVGKLGPDAMRLRPELARYRAHLSMSFPASAIQDLQPATDPSKPPNMVVTFLGLFGPSGILPQHYTARIIERERTRPREWEKYDDVFKEMYDKERRALRDWLDLFNHRFVVLFQRAWEKYRFFIPQERGEGALADPDMFTLAAYSYVGLGTHGLRDRLRLTAPGRAGEPEVVLGRLQDLGLLRYAGLLAQQHRNPWGLRVLLAEYFGLPTEVRQFQGQWLPLEKSSQTRLGVDGGNGELGLNTVAGDRVWDVQGKFRVRLGPLRYHQFLNNLPDRSPIPARKAFFLLGQLTRLYAGPEFDFDVQLVLCAADVPPCQLTEDQATGPRLGWNCWLLNEGRPATADAEDVVFEGEAITRLGDGLKTGNLRQ